MVSRLDPGSATDMLSSPNSVQRSESGYSHNYSLLEIYDVALDGDLMATHDSEDDIVQYTNTGLRSQQEAPPTAPVVDISDFLAIPETDSFAADDTILGIADATESTMAASLVVSLKVALPETRGVTLDRPQLLESSEKNMSRILESNFDMYGFKKQSSYFESSRASYNAWFKEYLSHLVHQRKKWNLLMKQNGLRLDGKKVPTRFPPKSDKLKKLVRKGIPPEWRGNAWFFYAGGYEKLNAHIGVYDKIVADTVGVKNKDTEVIERDLNRTFPDNIFFNSTQSLSLVSLQDESQPESNMIKSLRRVLVAFAHYLPHIGYCQSLNFLAGLLLLFMEEEYTFWMLVILTERILPKVHSANLEGVHTDQGVLMMCVREYIPKLWKIIGKSFDGEVVTEDKILVRLPPVTLVTSSWFMSVFVGVLPIESVLRVWDIIWYEGSKTIFRISLTICRLCLDHPKFSSREARDAESETEQIELFQFMQNFPKSITDPNLLVDSCYKKIGGYGYGFLLQDEINKCREFVSQQRNKIKKKTSLIDTGMSEQERQALQKSGSIDNEYHDVYGFNKSIMSGVMWNKHISNRMRKKFVKKT